MYRIILNYTDKYFHDQHYNAKVNIDLNINE